MRISFQSLLKKKNNRSKINEKQQFLQNLGREQFKKLIEKGIELPVVLL